VKTITLTPIGGELEVTTGSPLVKGLLACHLPVSMACGGRGLCASCHVYVRRGVECLTPRTPREEHTLRLIVTADADSRLACQTQVLADGAVIEIPAGLYVTSLQQVENLVGTKANQDFLHPLTGAVLIPRGKIITRTCLNVFAEATRELQRINQNNP
jgi:ferredoxin